MLLFSFLKFEIKYYKFLNLFLLITIPLSFYTWNSYTSLDIDFNNDIALKVKNISRESKVLMPLNETKYAYEYDMPNFYISYFHPIDWFNIQLMEEYFTRSEHYKNIYSFNFCSDIAKYKSDNNLNIEYIFINEKTIKDKKFCPDYIYLFEENQ